MNQTIIITIASLSGLGAIAAMILYVVARQFKVETDPRIDEIEEVLPATNCGGCGQPGCRAFAEALAQAADISDMHCPVGGNDVMKKVGEILGLEVKEKDPYIAVVKCSGSFEHRKKTNVYDGAPNCTVASMLYGGDTGCAYGCVGLGECVDACDFEAMYMDEKTGLPVVIEDKCTACNACVKACPKDIIELWPRGRKNRRIYVACINEDKGGIAKKYCSVACTGCEKCVEVCRYDSVIVENNLAVIDPEKCRLCKECVYVCGSDSIHMINFPPPKKDRPPVRDRKERPDRKLAHRKDEAEGVEVGVATDGEQRPTAEDRQAERERRRAEREARRAERGGSPAGEARPERTDEDRQAERERRRAEREARRAEREGNPAETEGQPQAKEVKDEEVKDKKDNSTDKENKA